MTHESRTSDSAFLVTYRDLKEKGKLHEHRLVRYECAKHHCLLADVFRIPDGVGIYWPRYKFSDDLNQRLSSAAGRAANTEDGNNRWKEQAGPLRETADAGVQCRHVRIKHLTNAEIEADIKAGRSVVSLPRDVNVRLIPFDVVS